MRITNLHHAALHLAAAADGPALLIDPGNRTPPLDAAHRTRLSGVVITHEHPDHFDLAHLEPLITAQPALPVVCTAAVAHHITQACPAARVIVAKTGETHRLPGFTLRIFGELHASIHHSIPRVHNLGVFVNECFYYGGDSLDVHPELIGRVALCAVPAGAPWLRIADVMDFVSALAPAQTFATHDEGLSDWGKTMSAERIASATASVGGTFVRLAPGETVTLAGAQKPGALNPAAS